METSAYPTRSPLWVAPLPLQQDGTRRINSVLIANRGEIACRVIATCRKLQIKSIAIYADEDAVSRHVSEADEAINLGSMDNSDGNPFLNIQLLVDIALNAGADAIHPGYGYLSENSRFADAVRAAGLIFIGPSSSAINTLGDKREAKEYLSQHEPSVPLIPGFTGSSSGIQLEDLQVQAERIGLPVMIKASAGGGGKGLRIVRDMSALESEFNRAQSEAQRSFGLSDCIMEKYIEAGKHVEVQIMGDSHGKVISLWERDCSVQRRHQKVVEESPCAWLNQSQREAMCAEAVKIGELLKYEGAGTVEFILDVATGNFYFLEVNARLQVEHPITEECTGLDLVSLQLFVASGGSLESVPHLQTIPQNGHAIECRLCAEDPQRDFAPQHGLIRVWAPSTTDSRENVRFETAIESGARVSIYFDSMIAKIVVWAPTRSMAIQRMARILSDTVCMGVSTNQHFLQACLLHEGFRRVDYTTSFIPTNLESLLKSPTSTAPVPSAALEAEEDANGAAVVTKAYNALSASLRAETLPNSETFSIKIHSLQTRRLDFGNGSGCEMGRIEVTIGRNKILGFVATGNHISNESDTGDFTRIFCHFPAIGTPLEYHCYSVLSYYESQRVAIAGGPASTGSINAPMPCKVLQVLKKAGDEVKTGEIVMIIESMKMEITIAASKDGKFESNVKEGEAVNEGVKLCSFN
ncbi:carbamoyl-phosphate synthase L chain, ATP binding domain-containing protein [Fusarium solani]|uniref:Carbamoyl-phosphate synthase L chain, ATP binding domain-containing protein n=1 Tax=Fusarium solani TaxID=169388 RepID=A0A9P9RE53_FUSSL|nr:carbamoyl-phosphate synthase L chain, ATP binding domain-containing protein [Fusarium solani]KAH7274765.1 carbamoyl-phosphate synthase L chain, ATP binding domain-containing protein [Fusarium solani]